MDLRKWIVAPVAESRHMKDREDVKNSLKPKLHIVKTRVSFYNINWSRCAAAASRGTLGRCIPTCQIFPGCDGGGICFLSTVMLGRRLSHPSVSGFVASEDGMRQHLAVVNQHLSERRLPSHLGCDAACRCSPRIPNWRESLGCDAARCGAAAVLAS